ncbi:MAG TPA: Rieske (2Fe-2S) protein [Synechococcales cyanobacterium M55_K2018_004]|nr:Rieske (2Fe-2S) protein [Synechococcales cyanobacterium M55_K2018_004]
MDRRAFLAWCGVGTIAGSLPWAIAACASSTTSTSSVAPGAFAPVGTLAQLDQDSQLLVKDGLAKPVLVIRDPTDAQKLIAVNPTCTHNRCTLAWKTAHNRFVCPCHNAQFNPDGTVAQGPATSPLPVYPVKVEAGQVLVQVL